MNKEFSIITIDLNKLDKIIDKYKGMSGEANPYIFMNENTAKAIEVEISDKFLPWDDYINVELKGLEAVYSGYKVFINNDLEFGIVEIR